MELDFGDGLCVGMATMFIFVCLWRGEWEKVKQELDELKSNSGPAAQQRGE